MNVISLLSAMGLLDGSCLTQLSGSCPCMISCLLLTYAGCYEQSTMAMPLVGVAGIDPQTKFN